jgi:hypothetical protein
MHNSSACEQVSRRFGTHETLTWLKFKPREVQGKGIKEVMTTYFYEMAFVP